MQNALEEFESWIERHRLHPYEDELKQARKFHNILKKTEAEDYTSKGNTRIGGLPDLPPDIDYPVNEDGYYNLLFQLNLSEIKVDKSPLPDSGILYLFQGDAQSGDYQLYFYDGPLENLNRKEPPEGMVNLNEEDNENPFKGVKATFGVMPYLDHGSEITEKIEALNPTAFDEICFPSRKYHSHILGDTVEGDSTGPYRLLKGFPSLYYDVLYDELGDGPEYQEQYNRLIAKAEKNIMGNDEALKAYSKRHLSELKRYHQEREIHLQSKDEALCLFGIESLDECEMCWNDAGFVYLFMLRSDLENRDFSNFHAFIWSS
ncbi:DUF1963 domain-containing protein [Fulvitalea axinellae]